jgi:hypothetical protein
LLEEHFGELAKHLDELTKDQRLKLREAVRRLHFPATWSMVASHRVRPAVMQTGLDLGLWSTGSIGA